MDLRALMQQLETINTTQTLTESVEERVVITESVATSNRRIEELTFKSSIARGLVEEFGYELDEEGRGSDEYQAAAGIKPQAAAPAAGAPADNRNIFQKGFDGVADFHKKNTERFNAKQAADAAANSPEGMAAAKAKLTPSQLAWLGGAQPSPEILQRMPEPTAKEKADSAAAAAAAMGGGIKPPKYGGLGGGLRPLDGSDDGREGGLGLKLPAQAPVTSVAAAQAALAPAPATAPASAPAPAPATAPAASTWKGQTDEFGGMEEKPKAAAPTAGKPASATAAAVATPVAPQTPNNATALPPLTPAAAAGATTDPRAAAVDRISKVSSQLTPAAAAPTAGAEEKKIARFKELLDKAKTASVTSPAATKESIGYFLNKMRFIESRQLNEALTPEEQKEMDGLAAELGGQGSENNPAIVKLINDYNSTTVKPAAAAPAAAAPAAAAPAAAAGYSYVLAGTDDSYAISNGFVKDGRPDLAAWKAAGSPGKPKPADSAPPAGSHTWDDPVSISGQDSLNRDMAQNKADAAKGAATAKPGADGAVGQDLARMGVTKQQRLDQAFVDKTLGAGKFTAGSAESNLALQAHFKKNGTVNQIGAAPAAAAPATRGMGDTVAVPKKLAPGIGIAAGTKPEGTPGQRPSMYKDPRIVGDELPAAAPATAASAPKPAASAPPPSRATGIVNRRVPAPPTQAESIVTQDDAILSMIRNIRVS